MPEVTVLRPGHSCPECDTPTRNTNHCDRCLADYVQGIRRRRAAEDRLGPLRGWWL